MIYKKVEILIKKTRHSTLVIHFHLTIVTRLKTIVFIFLISTIVINFFALNVYKSSKRNYINRFYCFPRLIGAY
jgi:hypothetical protein